jgi:hypothetical protein
VQARTDVVALLDLIAAEGTHTTVTDATLAHTDVPAALSPFSYVAPADLVLFLGITVLVLSSGWSSPAGSACCRLAAAPVRRRSVVAAQIATSLCVATVQCIGLLIVGRLLFGVHWGDPLGVFLVLAMLSLAYAGAAVLIEHGRAPRSRPSPWRWCWASCAGCWAAACTRSTWWDRWSAASATWCPRPGPWTRSSS